MNRGDDLRPRVFITHYRDRGVTLIRCRPTKTLWAAMIEHGVEQQAQWSESGQGFVLPYPLAVDVALTFEQAGSVVAERGTDARRHRAW